MYEQFLSRNLTFLRENLGIAIAELCEIIGVDPINYHILETNGISTKEKMSFYNLSPTAIEVCNYYTVTFDVMMFEDITLPENFDTDKLKLLKHERLQGQPIDRKSFFKQIYDSDYAQVDDSEKDVMKMLCYTAHKAERTNSRYWALRKAGKIPRHDFFEPE